MQKWIYLDNAATTPVHPDVLESMKPYFLDAYANPSGFSCFGDPVKEAVAVSRETIAGFLGANPNEIYFTGGGTESDNWALKSIADAYKDRGKHIITSKIEHHAVLHTCEYLEKNGYEITYLDVDENGLVNPDELRAAVRPDTILISVMFANNEIGTIQPISEIGKIAHENGVLFHTDAVQAYGHVPIDVSKMNIDLLSASGHKCNGPKGIGILYVRQGVKIGPFLHGGAQERGRRAGTLNTPGIVGFGKATEIAQKEMQARAEYETELRDYFIDRVLARIPHCFLNGDREKRLPNNVNISFQYVEGESVLILLDQKMICASSGSACTSGSLDPSHVLLAIGQPPEIARGSLRMTISEQNTKEELDYVTEELERIIGQLRSMSSLFQD